MEPEDTGVQDATQALHAARLRVQECEYALAQEQVRLAMAQALAEDRSLAFATNTLLGMIADLRSVGEAGQFASVCAHRKALAPLAEKHGVRIVRTGDGTVATVVTL